MQPEEPQASKLLAISVGLPQEVQWREQTIETGIFKSPIEGRVYIGDLLNSLDDEAPILVKRPIRGPRHLP